MKCLWRIYIWCPSERRWKLHADTVGKRLALACKANLNGRGFCVRLENAGPANRPREYSYDT